MGGLSIWHILLVLVVIMILFGAGKLPRVMGDLAKGIKSFKEGLKDESADSPKAVPGETAAPTASARTETQTETRKS
ncbi:MAG: twin-arginine translocase TatA/TatE family subunit [Gemmatimonas sp.]